MSRAWSPPSQQSACSGLTTASRPGSYSFKPDVNRVSNQLYNDITRQISQWEPTVQILSVTPNMNDPLSGKCPVDINFTQVFTPDSAVSTATVQIGGTVFEQ